MHEHELELLGGKVLDNVALVLFLLFKLFLYLFQALALFLVICLVVLLNEEAPLAIAHLGEAPFELLPQRLLGPGYYVVTGLELLGGSLLALLFGLPYLMRDELLEALLQRLGHLDVLVVAILD